MTSKSQFPVAVGVTDHETAILEYAAVEAGRADCRLRLVHAYAVPPSAMGTSYGYDIPAEFRRDGEQVLREAEALVADTIDKKHVNCVLSQGVPPTVLERESRSARLMVIGQDPPKPWYFRLYEGRSAHHLAEYSHCPVVIVPRTWVEVPRRDQVVAFVDGPRAAHSILEYAFSTAASRGAPLKIVHVAEDDPIGYERWHATKDVVDAWATAYPDVHLTMVVDHGSRQRIVVDAAKAAALVVLGQPHVELAARVFAHSLARAVITRAACPVAVVPIRREPISGPANAT